MTMFVIRRKPEGTKRRSHRRALLSFEELICNGSALCGPGGGFGAPPRRSGPPGTDTLRIADILHKSTICSVYYSRIAVDPRVSSAQTRAPPACEPAALRTFPRNLWMRSDSLLR